MRTAMRLLKVARPQFLIAGLTLFLLGAFLAVLAGSPLSLPRMALGCLVILSSQLAVHFSNDYFDADSDRPDSSTLISGGGGVLAAHPELRVTVKWIAIALTAFSLLAGIVLIWSFSFPYWTIGLVILGNLAGWCYSAPPVSLSHRGLGEICYTFVAGFLVPCVGYLTLRGRLDTGGIFLLAPLILYGLVSILSVEIPDLEADRAANKLTWIARMGRPLGFTLLGYLSAAATAYFFIFPRFAGPRTLFDLGPVGWLSLLPLAPTLLGLLTRPPGKMFATRIAVAVVATLILFAALLDSYLYLLVSR